MNKEFIKSIGVILIFLTLSSVVTAQTTRVRFARGRTSATLQGSLGNYGERSFVLAARNGQNLSATVSSRGNCIMFGNTTTSTNYVTENGDNYFNLMNRCKTSASYTLTVSIY